MLHGMHDANTDTQPPEIEHVGARDSLQWVLDLVQWTNIKLRDHIDISITQPRAGPIPT
jgi:hypothetical protein